eukprot:1851515-Amphidinium_carterae.1
MLPSQDGKSATLTAPNGPAQEEALTAALRGANMPSQAEALGFSSMRNVLVSYKQDTQNTRNPNGDLSRLGISVISSTEEIAHGRAEENTDLFWFTQLSVLARWVRSAKVLVELRLAHAAHAGVFSLGQRKGDAKLTLREVESAHQPIRFPTHSA